MSAESTVEFYHKLIRTYVDRYGDTGYPEIVIFSVTFKKFWDWSVKKEWDKFAAGIADVANSLEKSGADFGIIAANMPHVVYDDVCKQTSLPLLHIADSVAAEAKLRGYKRVALMGTIPTMNAKFYPSRLENAGIECIVPNTDEQGSIQNILESELFLGVRTTESKQKLINIIKSLKTRGADSVILACTELPMLLNLNNSSLPLLDSEVLFVQSTLEMAMADITDDRHGTRS